jgi:hypothetical protein
MWVARKGNGTENKKQWNGHKTYKVSQLDNVSLPAREWKVEHNWNTLAARKGCKWNWREWTVITESIFTIDFLIRFSMYRILNGAQEEPSWATLWATRRATRKQWQLLGDKEEGKVW